MNDTQNYIYQKEGCPFAAKATALLDKHRIPYRVHVFADATEERLFKEERGGDTTPQVVNDRQRTGGYGELAAHFGEQPETESPEARARVISPMDKPDEWPIAFGF